jgi:hypothetical protein
VLHRCDIKKGGKERRREAGIKEEAECYDDTTSKVKVSKRAVKLFSSH